MSKVRSNKSRGFGKETKAMRAVRELEAGDSFAIQRLLMQAELEENLAKIKSGNFNFNCD